MKEYFKNNVRFLLLLVIWLLTGIFTGQYVFWGVLVVSLYLLASAKMYSEMFIGFWFILILSDSRQEALSFAVSSKEIYVSALFLFLFVFRKDFVPFNTIFRYFIPFFIAAFIALYKSTPDALPGGIQKTLSYFILLFTVPNYIQKAFTDNKEIFFKNLIYFCALLLIAGFVLKMLAPEIVTVEGRFTGILGNPNGLGIFGILFFLLFSVILNLYPELFSKNEKRIFYALILGSIILCGSRSAMFAILIFFVFKYFYKLNPFLSFIVFLFLLFSYDIITSNIESLIYSLGLEDFFRIKTLEEGSGRTIAWKFAWDNIVYDPFIGRGFSYTDNLFKQYYNELSLLGHQGNAHNSYLTFWLDTGVFGVLFYLSAVFALFYKGAKNSRLAIPIMYAVLFSATFESWLTASLNPFTIQFFIILTLITGGQFRKKTEAEDPVPVQ